MMRIYVLVIVVTCSLYAQTRFKPDYFVKKHSIQLPEITENMLDISELTHSSDTWEYFYKGKTTKLDSVVRNLTIERFEPSRRVNKYNYMGDSVLVREISISKNKGDTLNNYITTFKNNFRAQAALDLETNCIWCSEFDERGIKILDVKKCPDQNQFSGQEFTPYTTSDYIEYIETYKGKVDSNSIRRYYLAPFDSIVADYMVKKNTEPFIVQLNIFNKFKKREIGYGFGIFSNINEVEDINYYTYTKSGELYRVYLFRLDKKETKTKKFILINYTEYEYDKLDRKIRMTTRVKPDPK